MFTLLLLTAAAPMDPPAVSLPDPPPLVVRVADLERRVAALEARGMSAAPVRSPVRSGNYHTHTCINGHTWDHSVTTGHNCPICGASQFVQDRTPRPVTIVQRVPVVVPVSDEPPPLAPDTGTIIARRFGSVATGCSGAGCSSGLRSPILGQRLGFRLFGRVLLRGRR